MFIRKLYRSLQDHTAIECAQPFVIENQLAARAAPPNQAQSIATNFTHTGDPTSSTCPVGVSFPVFASILSTTMLSDFWFAANSSVLVGSIAKLRGSLPFVEAISTVVSVPFLESMANTAM